MTYILTALAEDTPEARKAIEVCNFLENEKDLIKEDLMENLRTVGVDTTGMIKELGDQLENLDQVITRLVEYYDLEWKEDQ